MLHTFGKALKYLYSLLFIFNGTGMPRNEKSSNIVDLLYCSFLQQENPEGYQIVEDELRVHIAKLCQEYRKKYGNNNNNHSSLLSLWNHYERHSETITIPPAHVAPCCDNRLPIWEQ
jgi:hypothetical protein